MKNLLILGAGTAGTMMANKMLEKFPAHQWQITLVDRDDLHIYQPGLLFLPFGMYNESDIVRSRREFVNSEIKYIQSEIKELLPQNNQVLLSSGDTIDYDLLLIATGCEIDPQQTEGLAQEDWYKNIFDFYTLDGAALLRNKLATFKQGRLVLNIVDMPIKCPVAPLEFMFLADDFFTQQGVRDQIELVYATPLDGAFTKPQSSSSLGQLLIDKNIKVESNFNIEKVTSKSSILGHDGRDIAYDILVSVPLHSGVKPIAQSDLSDDMGFVEVDKHSLQSLHYDNIFAIGDATNAPASKAGSVAHFQSEVLAQNMIDYLEGRPLSQRFDGHSNCFIETGKGKAMLIDFNYETEPLAGKFPLPGIGPFSLLEESELNHWGKLAFKWVYWHMLLSGKELPMDHRMLMYGKRSS